MQVVLGNDQVLLSGCDRALRADRLNRRRGSDLRLSLRILKRLLRVGESLLLHAHVLEGIDKIPVHVFDLIDCRNDLQAEGDVGDLAVILRDADESRVGEKSEALQQVLRKAKLKVGTQLRRQKARSAVRGEMRVVERAAKQASELKGLAVAHIRSVGVLREDRYRAERACRLGVVLVELQVAG